MNSFTTRLCLTRRRDAWRIAINNTWPGSFDHASKARWPSSLEAQPIGASCLRSLCDAARHNTTLEGDLPPMQGADRRGIPMPVNQLPPIEREWPAYLPPPGGGPPMETECRNWRPTTKALRRGLRILHDPIIPLPWQERRRIYLERKGRAE